MEDTIFDEIPGGIVLYKWTGKELKVLRMSKYYQDLYGHSLRNSTDQPDFMRIHPDDVEDYKKAIMRGLTKTHYLEYVFRVWDPKSNRYIWTQINARSKPQPDGTSYVYAMYSDVTEQKDAEIAAAKKQASLEAALSVSNQLCCEYDPELHMASCLTRDNIFHINAPMYHYPECLRGEDLVHPEDMDLFIRTVHASDDGLHSTHCDVRVKKDGEYRWYSCRFQPYFDSKKGRNIVILTITDATLRIASIKDYEDRIQLLVKSYQGSLAFSLVNLTKNTFESIKADDSISCYLDLHQSIDQVMRKASKAVVGESDQKKYEKIFNCENLITGFENGQTSVKMEHLMQLSPTHIEWIESGFDLMRHPVTGDIVGVCHIKSINRQYIARSILEKTMQCDYLLATAVYMDSGEYYIFCAGENEYCEHHQNFWEDMKFNLTAFAEGQELENARKNLAKENVMKILGEGKEFSYTFNGFNYGTSCRMEAKAVYLNKEQNLIMATLRDITDAALLKKYKYESEHDLLTGLLNRKTLFSKCRQLLKEHPDEQFIMMHADMKHFHLYNTFFGDEAGDRILCEIADCLREMDKDYEFWAFGRIEADVFCTFFPLRRDILDKHVKLFLDRIVAFRSDFLIEPALGLYVVKDPTMSIESMFTRAGIAAKSDKKNLYDLFSLYDDEMEQKIMDSQQVIGDMQKAIEREEFQVYLQPKYSLRTEKMAGAEALVRWFHPEKGMISPAKFIPIFEGNGFVTTLDRYMWEHVLMILRRWQDEGKPMYPISVNVSRISMYIQSTVPFLKDLVTRYGIDPKYLELELTESAYMDDPEDLKRMLIDLKEFGFKILMDDFGSGYSSLNTLRELPVDVLKLDMKFLSESQSDDRGCVVLSSVVRMSKLLNLPIVAEGVENREQADYLFDIGCEYAQGYLFSKPMPVSEFEKLIETHTENTESEMEKSAEHIVNMLSFNNSAGSAAGDSFPAALAFMEYRNGRISVLRCNKKFMEQFGLIEDPSPASKIMKEKLTSHSYDVLMTSLKKAIEQKETISFGLSMNGKNGKEKWIGSVNYEGVIDQTAYLMIAFTNVSNIQETDF